jgi:dihydrofolate reductase
MTGGKVYAEVSMSLDGFIAGPNAGPDNPLGDGGDRLHEWIYGLESWREPHGLSGGETNPDNEVVKESFARMGAVVMGKRMFDEGERPWGDNPPFHAPVFVVTHETRETVEKDGGTTYTFVTDGIESALKQATEDAGGKDVAVAGAITIRQFIEAGLLDDMLIHVIPVLFGDGVRLFDRLPERVELETTRVISSPAATHLSFRVVK